MFNWLYIYTIKTYNRDLFKGFRPGQSYAARLENKELAGIFPELEKLGMQSASTEDYLVWIEGRRRQVRCGLPREKVAC